MSQAVPDPVSPLMDAVARLLRPLVRLLIRHGVTSPTLMDLVRGLYVDVAREMLPDERSRTDSRISLMTGVHRKELRRYRTLGTAPAPLPVTVGSQVLARWLGQAGWQDSEHRPTRLPRTAPEGEPSF